MLWNRRQLSIFCSPFWHFCSLIKLFDRRTFCGNLTVQFFNFWITCIKTIPSFFKNVFLNLLIVFKNLWKDINLYNIRLSLDCKCRQNNIKSTSCTIIWDLFSFYSFSKIDSVSKKISWENIFYNFKRNIKAIFCRSLDLNHGVLRTL